MKHLLLFATLIVSITAFADGNKEKNNSISIGAYEKPTSPAEPKERPHPQNPDQERKDKQENPKGIAVKIPF